MKDRYIVGVDLAGEPSKTVHVIGKYDHEKQRLTIVLPDPKGTLRVTGEKP